MPKIYYRFGEIFWNPYCQVEFRWYHECRMIVGLFGDPGRHEHVSCARYERGVQCIGRRGWADTGVLPITVPNALVYGALRHVPPRLPTI